MVPCATSLPINGWTSTHTWIDKCGKVPFMGKDVTEIIAENLSQYIGDGKRFVSQLGFERSTGVPQSTLNRALSRSGNLRVDNVERLSKALGLQPWQLLVPGLTGGEKPELAPPYGTSDPQRSHRATLLSQQSRIEALSAAELQELETAIGAALAVIEKRRHPTRTSIAETILEADTSMLVGSPDVHKKAAKARKTEKG